jgi:two-component system cell cycle sensor histidine kinase/response regulator CckA
MEHSREGACIVTDKTSTRILYMEDDPGLSRLLQKGLRRRGFIIDIAANGAEGLAMLEEDRYDLLLVDYHMPVLGGIDVIRRLSSRNAPPPTIMITGEGNEMVAVEALKLGAADYIVKDVGMQYLDLLPSVIDQVLLRQQMLKERLEMIEAVRASEERYRVLFESNPVPSMVYDLQTFRILAVNTAAVIHYGYTREEFLSLNIKDLYTPDELPLLLNILADLDQGEKQDGAWKHRLKNGSQIDVDITSHSLLLNGLRANLILANDVTEHNKMKETLLRGQKLESLGLLAGGLAHDFNNLLTAILGNISLARVSTTSAESRDHHLEVAEQATGLARDLTGQLLTFSSGGAPIKKPFSSARMLEDSARHTLSGCKSRCEFKIASDLWTIEADERQLAQVVRHLILNADQAMPEGGMITVSGENLAIPTENPLLLKTGDYIRISVADQGPGIPDELREKIFDPYFTTKDKKNGLGLATCYSIMKQHDGHIAVESTLGAGTTFILYLPASSGLPIPIAPETSADPKSGTGRILVMDDEDIVRDILCESLSSLGYDVVCSREGNETIALYEQAMKSGHPFDAVIMDLTIPGGLGGKEAVIKLREIDPGVKAIVSSGYSSDPIMAHFKEYGFSGVVSKPYSLQTLSETVEKVIAGDAA